jgi:hypothetical protein
MSWYLVTQSISRLVVRDEVRQTAALRRRVLRVAGHHQVQPRLVPKPYIGSGCHAAKDVARYLVRGKPPRPAEFTGDAVLAAKPEHALVHLARLRF